MTHTRLFVVTVNKCCSVFTDKNKAYKELCNHMFFWELPCTNERGFEENYNKGQYKEALEVASASTNSRGFYHKDNFEFDVFSVVETSVALDESEYED